MTNTTQINHNKQALISTFVLFVLLFLLFFYLKYNTQTILNFEGGGGGGNIAVNFGDSDQGQGDNLQATTPAQQAPTPPQTTTPQPEQIVTNQTDDTQAPTIAPQKTTPKPKTPETPKPQKPTEPQKPKPSKTTTDALSNLLNANTQNGDGNDNTAGNKGKNNGQTTASGYDGTGGTGTGSGGGSGSGQGLGSGSGYGSGSGAGSGGGQGNYYLNGRKAISKPDPKYDCNEQGIVVVEISVNNAGVVTAVVAGTKGTTNTAKCLLDQAKIAAQNTRFDANATAPNKQIGKIIYSFKLTK